MSSTQTAPESKRPTQNSKLRVAAPHVESLTPAPPAHARMKDPGVLAHAASARQLVTARRQRTLCEVRPIGCAATVCMGICDGSAPYGTFTAEVRARLLQDRQDWRKAELDAHRGDVRVTAGDEVLRVFDTS